MPQTALPNLGLDYDWELGIDGWKTGMDDNLALLDALVMPYTNFAIGSIAAEPGAPTNGDAYIIAESGSITGTDWGGSPQKWGWFAVYYSGTGWHFAEPRDGWTIKDRTTGLWYEYYNGTWNAMDIVSFQLACSDLTTELVAGNDVAYFRAPFAFEILDVRLSLLNAAGGSPIGTVSPEDLYRTVVDINRDGTTTIFGATKPRILQGNNSSIEESPIAHAFVLTSISDDQLLTVDIDQAPLASPNGASGLMVTIIGARKKQ